MGIESLTDLFHRQGCFQLLMCEAEENISFGRRIGHAVVHDLAGIIAPDALRKIIIGLEGPAGDGWIPRNDGLVANACDGQQRCAGRLHGEQTPEAAGQRIVTAGQHITRVVLAYRSTQGIHAACARPTAAGNFMPGNRVGLGVEGRDEQPQ